MLYALCGARVKGMGRAVLYTFILHSTAYSFFIRKAAYTRRTTSKLYTMFGDGVERNCGVEGERERVRGRRDLLYLPSVHTS